ncbi:unnamed protein product, partial [Protopolystoma xenopodis]
MSALFLFLSLTIHPQFVPLGATITLTCLASTRATEHRHTFVCLPVNGLLFVLEYFLHHFYTPSTLRPPGGVLNPTPRLPHLLDGSLSSDFGLQLTEACCCLPPLGVPPPIPTIWGVAGLKPSGTVEFGSWVYRFWLAVMLRCVCPARRPTCTIWLAITQTHVRCAKIVLHLGTIDHHFVALRRIAFKCRMGDAWCWTILAFLSLAASFVLLRLPHQVPRLQVPSQCASAAPSIPPAWLGSSEVRPSPTLIRSTGHPLAPPNLGYSGCPSTV